MSNYIGCNTLHTFHIVITLIGLSSVIEGHNNDIRVAENSNVLNDKCNNLRTVKFQALQYFQNLRTNSRNTNHK